MIKTWIEKLKRLFDQEDIEEMPEERRKKSPVKAKMTYQYPEEKPFRFPLIPDETVREQPVRKKTAREKAVPREMLETAPAYLRRRQRTERKVQPINRNTAEHPRKVQRDENAPPFQVTEVPSPVYGFQKRENITEKVPAFARRGMKDEQVKQPEAKPEEKREDKPETNKAERLFEEAADVAEPEETETQNLHNKPARPKNNKERRQRPHQTNKKHQGTAIPFNVIMTPKDRERIQHRQESYPDKPAPLPVPTAETEAKTELQREDEPKKTYVPAYLLDDTPPDEYAYDPWIKEQKHLLEQTLTHFHVAAKVVHATQGPSVTRFEVQPELGVKVSKIKNLSDDLKLNMSAKDIRIEAPIPGKNTVGIEVPNPKAQMVGLQEIIDTEQFKNSKSPLTIALGVTIEGKPKITNIQKMPHGLIAGATGSGKSVCINTILISILYKASHEDVKFLLIDPKMVELAPYNGIPHLVAPVITDVKAATQSLKWAVHEMEERYERFMEEGVRDVERFNRKVIAEGRSAEKMPYIVIVIDELADLMMMSPQDVENAISRIAQKARACGMHLLLATQRPSVDVITGLIKANIPTRIAFSVSSQVDSRTILDASGAEKLLGKGDMLFMENGTGKSVRLQGPFVSDDEIERVTAFARDVAEPEYLFEQEELLAQIETEEDEDELLEEAIQFVLRQQSASTSMLQRHFKIGYNRAARLIDTLEARGIISGQNGSKPRDVLVTETYME